MAVWVFVGVGSLFAVLFMVLCTRQEIYADLCGLLSVMSMLIALFVQCDTGARWLVFNIFLLLCVLLAINPIWVYKDIKVDWSRDNPYVVYRDKGVYVNMFKREDGSFYHARRNKDGIDDENILTFEGFVSYYSGERMSYIRKIQIYSCIGKLGGVEC